MTNFIRCPSCAFCIGKYNEFFDNAKLAIFEEVVFSDASKVSDFDHEKLALNPGSVPPMEIIFDACGIKNRCCRMRLLTKTDFDRAYK